MFPWPPFTTECCSVYRSLHAEQEGSPRCPRPLGGAGRQLGSHPVSGLGASGTREETQPHPAEISGGVDGEGCALLAGLCR